MKRTARPGTLYLFCFRNADGSKGWVGEPGQNGAAHYLGFAPQRRRSYKRGLAERVDAHRRGAGAKVTAAAVRAGLDLVIARTWRPATEAEEKYLKDRNNPGQLCFLCHPGTKAGSVLKAKQYRRPRPVTAAAAAAAMAALAVASQVPAVDPSAAPWPEEPS
jgi:hypothetical protein